MACWRSRAAGGCSTRSIWRWWAEFTRWWVDRGGRVYENPNFRSARRGASFFLLILGFQLGNFLMNEPKISSANCVRLSASRKAFPNAFHFPKLTFVYISVLEGAISYNHFTRAKRSQLDCNENEFSHSTRGDLMQIFPAAFHAKMKAALKNYEFFMCRAVNWWEKVPVEIFICYSIRGAIYGRAN